MLISWVYLALFAGSLLATLDLSDPISLRLFDGAGLVAHEAYAVAHTARSTSEGVQSTNIPNENKLWPPMAIHDFQKSDSHNRKNGKDVDRMCSTDMLSTDNV